MKYTIDTVSKIITIEGQISSEELKGLCETYPDYSFNGGVNYVPYYPYTAPLQPYYGNLYQITCESTGTIPSSSNLSAIATSGGTDTTQGFAGKTALN